MVSVATYQNILTSVNRTPFLTRSGLLENMYLLLHPSVRVEDSSFLLTKTQYSTMVTQLHTVSFARWKSGEHSVETPL